MTIDQAMTTDRAASTDEAAPIDRAPTGSPVPSGARLLRGERDWWFLGPGGVARLGDRHVTADGVLRPEAADRLRDSGMFTTPGSGPTP